MRATINLLRNHPTRLAIQNNQAENHLEGAPGLRSHSIIEIQSIEQTAKSEQVNLKRKPSLVTRVGNAIKPSLRRRPDPLRTKHSGEGVLKKSGSMSRARGPGRPNGNGVLPNNNVVDLTSDSDDESDVLVTHWRRVSERLSGPELGAPPDEARPQPMAIDREFFNMPNPFQQRAQSPAPLAPHGEMFANDEAYARALQDEFASNIPVRDPGPPGHPQTLPAPVFDGGLINQNNTPPESLEECLHTIEAVFPGICHDYVARLFQTISKSSERLIDHVLTEVPYPRARDQQMALKRKRQFDSDEEAARKYEAPDRVIPVHLEKFHMYM